MNYWTNRAKVKSMRLYNEKKQSFYPRINHGEIPASFITHRYMVPFVLPAGFSFWRGQGHAPAHLEKPVPICGLLCRQGTGILR